MVIGDNPLFPYRSSSFITRFFSRCDLNYVHDGSTRCVWTRTVLSELNLGPGVSPNLPSTAILRVIDELFDGYEFEKHKKSIQDALQDLSKLLSREGLEAYLDEDDRCRIRNKKTPRNSSALPQSSKETGKSMRSSRKKMITGLVDDARRFRFCGPSDDPDEQMAVTTAFRHLVIQFQRLAGPILPERAVSQLKAINVDVDNIYSAYEAKAELDALLPDIEDALALYDEAGMAAGGNLWIIDPALISQLEALESSIVDVATLIRICKEINSSYAHGNVLATVLLMRTVLNHIPPVFGQNSFEQVVANSGKSLKESFGHLENGLRKVADFHAHRKIAASEFYPSVAQVEPFKPQFELLIHEVLRLMK